ncbi:MAG: T9SS type A sorting domain-containing protein, partial [Ignavibacteriaceae bacterium]
SVSPYSSWSSAININSGHNIKSDDICAITAFDGNKIGVLWSNQNDKKFQFKYHLDNNNNTTWSNLEIASGSASGSVADDHMNIAVGSDGTIYAAVKTSYDQSNQITIGLLVRKNSNWNLYGVTNGSGTRPIALLDESNNKVYVIYTHSSTSDADMVYNYSNTSNISFSSQHTLKSGNFNNVTSTKQTFTNDVVVLYENADGNSPWSGVIAGTQSLPVELAFFSGALNGGEIKLTWRTDTEVNNYGFNIENSINNGDWSNIGFIEGYGNSNSPKYYDFSDGNINSAGEYHYRLKQVDNDGTFEYSDVITVLVTTPINFYLSQNYPNPFNPTTKIDFSLPEKQMVSLRVYNTLGEMVSELVNEVRESGNYSETFDASNLPSGVYVYRLQTQSFAANNKMTFLK